MARWRNCYIAKVVIPIPITRERDKSGRSRIVRLHVVGRGIRSTGLCSVEAKGERQAILHERGGSEDWSMSTLPKRVCPKYGNASSSDLEASMVGNMLAPSNQSIGAAE
ncbi:hypothetical protein AAG570_004271 [Ranatra chinensis]|uniref:Uncharacterized protein n=1 Tax=Ranatra chinensis TaxID=642074 RepID=A0ABD0YD17_9HEMI